MADPIRVPLSPFQLARFAAFDADAQAVNQRVSDSVTAIVAGVVDTTTLAGWDIRLVGAEIVCTPPPGESKPRLVPDIGPDGVSESAANG